MELNEKLSQQKDAFCNARDTDMSDEEYAILLITFPAFRVAQADGIFDQEEKEIMRELIQSLLTEIYSSELSGDQYQNMIESYLEDFSWIKSNEEVWKTKMANGLTLLCNDVEGLKDDIKNMMNEMAEASDGVSEDERTVMKAISEEVDGVADYEKLM